MRETHNLSLSADIKNFNSRHKKSSVISMGGELLFKTYEDIREHLTRYDNALDYQEKERVRDELMQEKHVRIERSMQEKIEKQSRSLIIHPTLESLFDDTSTFELSNQQRFLKRFLSEQSGNTGILIWHSTGMGKTCSSLGVAENYLDVLKGKVMIIGSDVVQQRFKDEILSNGKTLGCLGDSILNRISPAWKLWNDSEMERNVSQYVSKKFDFRTLRKLLNDFERDINFEKKMQEIIDKEKQLKNEEQTDDVKKALDKMKEEKYILHSTIQKYIRVTFSNRVIIYDEIHNMRIDDSETRVNSKGFIEFMELIMKFAKNVRLILISATPMFHLPSEIVPIMKVLMLNDKSFPKHFSKVVQDTNFDNNLTAEFKKLLIYFSSNYVSYASIDKTSGAYPSMLSPFVGDESQEYKLTEADDPHTFKDQTNKDVIEHRDYIYKSYLSKHQIDVLRSLDVKGEAKGKQYAMKALEQRLVNICYGENAKGFKDYFRGVEGGGALFKYKKEDSELKEGRLKVISPKIHAILESVNLAKGEGIIMIYSRFRGSGTWPICVALEEAGFDRYGDDKNFIRAKKGSRTQKYALLTSRSDEGGMFQPHLDNKALIEAVNSESNSRGDAIRVIVCTDVVKEGVDFKNVREIHILEPWYNESKQSQIIGRGIRMFSHESHDPDQRNVTVYKHCCVYPADSKGIIDESLDYYTFKTQQQNTKRIREIEGILKSNAIDCSLTGSDSTDKVVKDSITMRNKRVKHEILVSERTCANVVKESVDHRRLMKHDIHSIEQRIIMAFQNKKLRHISIASLKTELGYEKKGKIFELAVSEIVKEKKLFSIDGDGHEGRIEQSGEHLLFVEKGIEYPRVSKMQMRLYQYEKRSSKTKEIHVEIGTE